MQSESEPAGRLRAPDLEIWVAEIFQRAGVPVEDADLVARVLVDADLTGKHTHGVSRLPMYLQRIQAGLIATHPEMPIVRPVDSNIASMDGGNGLGPVVAWKAMEHAVVLAEGQGVGALAVHHSNHCGALYAYCAEAARRGFVLMAMTNSPPGMAPFGGREAFLGTNPVAFGFPRGRGLPPLVIDLATSVAARGNILQAARLNEEIPPGWAIDREGHPTTNAKAALAGAVLPMAGAKGFALALAVEVWTAVLSGAGIGPEVKNPYTDPSAASNVGHFFLALDPARLVSPERLGERMAQLEDGLREVPPSLEGPVSLPGDRSERTRQTYLRDGIPLDRTLIAQLDELGRQVDWPLWPTLVDRGRGQGGKIGHV